MADYSLADELLAISSIYGDDVLIAEAPSSGDSNATTTTFATLLVPDGSDVRLRLAFPPTYPASAPPRVIAVVSSGSAAAAQGRGREAMELVAATVARKFAAGEPVMFEVLEALAEGHDDGGGDDHGMERGGGDDHGMESGGGNDYGTERGGEGQTVDGGSTGPSNRKGGSTDPSGGSGGADGTQTQPPRWTASDAVTEKKSTFVAHACAVAGPDEARRAAGLLVAGDRRFAKATHNISAFRGRLAAAASAASASDGEGKTIESRRRNDLIFQDCDDDGEDAAGGRLLHLLELTGAENVLVVVSRWYGGVKLGPDRFRIINQVAREALVRGGWVREGGSGGGATAGKTSGSSKKAK